MVVKFLVLFGLIGWVQGLESPCCCKETQWEATEKFSIGASSSKTGLRSYTEVGKRFDLSAKQLISQTCNCKKGTDWRKRWVEAQRNINVENCFVVGQ